MSTRSHRLAQFLGPGAAEHLKFRLGSSPKFHFGTGPAPAESRSLRDLRPRSPASSLTRNAVKLRAQFDPAQAYLRDIFCLLHTWPASRLLELAPAFWKQTLQQQDAQQRLAANVFRTVTLAEHHANV